MFRNYLLTALRQFRKHRLLTAVQLLGLATSITTSLFLLLYVRDEWSFDRYHEKADRLFRLTTRVVTADSDDHVAFSLFVVAPRVQELYPEVADYVRLLPSYHKKTVQYGAKRFNEAHVLAADASVFSLFSYPLLRGNPSTALADPGGMVVSESFAQRYFDGEDPLGKTLLVNGTPYRVTGLMQDVPTHSDLYLEALLSLDDPAAPMDEWSYTFLLLKPGVRAPALEKKLTQFAREPLFDSYDEDASNLKTTYYLEPLPEVHFLEGRQYDQPKGNSVSLYLFSVLAVLLLAVAGVNSVNLFISQAFSRMRETGVRKALGATSWQIGWQGAGEIFLLLASALLLAGLVTLLVFPLFNQLTGKHFSLRAILINPAWLVLLGLVLLLGILTSGYLSFQLNRFKLAEVLKGKTFRPGSNGLGSVLVVFQFAAAITLMSGALLVYQQMQFLHQRDLGFRPDQVVVILTPGEAVSKSQIEAFRNRLLNSSAVKGVSLCDVGGEPGSFMNKDLFLVEQEGRMQEKVVANVDCDDAYLSLLAIRLQQGRNFSRARISDDKAYIVNEALVRWMGWKEPLGKKIEFLGVQGEVIGVVHNFHFTSLHRPVAPLILMQAHRIPEKMLLKTSGSSGAETVATVKATWQELFPDHPFESHFLAESQARQYQNEQQMRQGFTWGAGITLGVACMGLLAMTSLACQKRVKEIGVRKVLGASKTSIIFLMLKSFLSLVLCGILPALPLVWYLGTWWLESFVYRIPSLAVPLAAAATVTVGWSGVAILYHSVTASLVGPATVLRTE